MMPSDDAGVGIELVKEWAIEFEKLWEAVGGCFFRHDLRGRTKGYVRGLFGNVERKNGGRWLSIWVMPLLTRFSVFWTARFEMPTMSGMKLSVMGDLIC